MGDSDVVTGELVPVRTSGTIATRRPEGTGERPLSAGARDLVIRGMNASTLETYTRQWQYYAAFGEQVEQSVLPSAESLMIEYLHSWEALPVHNRCAGGRRSDGEPCGGHRPSPPTMWIWYSAVRFFHRIARPPFAWYGGERLALAMKAYREDAVMRLGWVPNESPRAWPEHVMAMVDSMDLTNPKHMRDRAVILTGWYTGARASDLATYRIGDVVQTPLGIDLALRDSKTNRVVGKKIDRRVLRPNLLGPQYDAVMAVRAWLALLRTEYAISHGALFRPFSKPGKNSPGTLLRGHRDEVGYRMSRVSISDIVKEHAIRAGIPDAEYFTEHSLRRGRATHLRTLRVDSLSIGRALGWKGLPPMVYLDEADAFDELAPANIGMLV